MGKVWFGSFVYRVYCGVCTVHCVYLTHGSGSWCFCPPPTRAASRLGPRREDRPAPHPPHGELSGSVPPSSFPSSVGGGGRGVLLLKGLYRGPSFPPSIPSLITKFRRERLQSHIWLTASSNVTKYLRISSYIRKHFLIYDFATAPIWNSLYMRKLLFSFLSM